MSSIGRNPRNFSYGSESQGPEAPWPPKSWAEQTKESMVIRARWSAPNIKRYGEMPPPPWRLGGTVGFLRRVGPPIGHATVWGPTRQWGYTWRCPGTALAGVTFRHVFTYGTSCRLCCRSNALSATGTTCKQNCATSAWTSPPQTWWPWPESLCWNAYSGMREMPPLNYIRLSHFSCKIHFGMDGKSVLSPLKLM